MKRDPTFLHPRFYLRASLFFGAIICFLEFLLLSTELCATQAFAKFGLAFMMIVSGLLVFSWPHVFARERERELAASRRLHLEAPLSGEAAPARADRSLEKRLIFVRTREKEVSARVRVFSALVTAGASLVIAANTYLPEYFGVEIACVKRVAAIVPFPA